MSSANKSILITGHTGFVGKAFVKHLLNKTSIHLILCQRSESAEALQLPDAVIEIADLTDPGNFRNIFIKHRPHTVIHLGGLTRLAEGENMPDLAWQTNVEGTQMLFKLAAEFGAGTFLYVSSDLARNAKGVIGLTKYCSEAILMNYPKPSPKVLILRLPNVSFTPGSVHTIFKKQIAANKELTITHRKMSRRFVSRSEVIDYLMEVLSWGVSKKVYVVDKAVERILDLAKNMIEESGKSLDIDSIGMKAGEKLIEESYGEEEIEHTGFRNLAFLKNNRFSDESVRKALELFNAKTLLKKQIDLLSVWSNS